MSDGKGYRYIPTPGRRAQQPDRPPTRHVLLVYGVSSKFLPLYRYKYTSLIRGLRE